MIERYVRPKYVFWLLIVLALLRGLMYAIAVPPWQHPDEPTHFEHLRFIAETNRLPTAEDFSIPVRWEIAISMEEGGFWDPDPPPEITEQALASAGISTLGIYTFSHPRLYYILAAVWLKPWLGLSVEGQLLIVRLLSVIMNMIVVVTSYLAVQLLLPKYKWLPIAVMAFIVFHPGNTDMMSAVNNDSLINAIGALFFLASAAVFSRGVSVIRIATILLLLVIGFFVKTTFLVLLISLPFLFVLYLYNRNHKTYALGIILIGLLIVTILLVFGQIDKLPAWFDVVKNRISNYTRVNIPLALENLTNQKFLAERLDVASTVFRGSWGTFGWGHVMLSPLFYWIMAGVSVVALAGFVKPSKLLLLESKGQVERKVWGIIIGLSAVFVFTAWFLAILRSFLMPERVFLSHGRYTFIAIIPFALLFTIGLSNWVSKSKWRVAGIVFTLFIVLFDAIAFWGYLVPAYY